MSRRMRWYGAGILAFMILCGARSSAASGSLELARNGRSNFSVYVGADASPGVLASVDTLRRCFEEISGVRLEIARARRTSGRRIIF